MSTTSRSRSATGDPSRWGLLRGPGAWAQRQPGSPGPLGTGLSGAASTRARTPGRWSCPLDHVLSIGSAVHVDPWADAFLAGSDGLDSLAPAPRRRTHPRRARRRASLRR